MKPLAVKNLARHKWYKNARFASFWKFWKGDVTKLSKEDNKSELIVCNSITHDIKYCAYVIH